ncbi:MAG: ROK family transcriptional regulator [Gemmataceae bacterium]
MAPSGTLATITTIRPSMVGRLNERQVLRVLQDRGPLSRADVARECGLSPPTVSKAVASLLKVGLLEEADAPEIARGRPAPRLRLASATAQVLGVTIDGGHCEVVSAGLDGELHADLVSVPTPTSYTKLLDALEAAARELIARPGVRTLGLGVSLPGLVDYRKGCGVLSPNLPITDGHAPAADLAGRLGIECSLLQESHALCLAEREYGLARGLDDFAMLDVGTGVGLGVMSGGRLVTGHSGLAGEVGHLTAVADGGRPCGCGNRGCLETVASDRALALRASEKLGHDVDVDEVMELLRAGTVDLADELRAAVKYLAVGVAAVLNLFNPATLFIHTRLFETDPDLFDEVVRQAGARALPPAFADCRIVPAKGSKRQGAVAGIVRRLTDAVAQEV